MVYKNLLYGVQKYDYLVYKNLLYGVQKSEKGKMALMVLKKWLEHALF